MKSVLTLGEVMLRLSPPNHQRFAQATSLDLEFGGSEANVGAALANWGIHVRHVTSFPKNDLGHAAAAHLRKNGINDSLIHFTEGRMGVYFLEHGAASRGSKIIYDRAASSFSRFDGQGIDWKEVLKNTDWVHWSGISPAISQEAADLVFRILEAANALNIPVSGDLNYRSNLWNYGKQAHEIMPDLMKLTQVMIAGTRDFNQCLNRDFKSINEVKSFAFDTFPNLQTIVRTERQINSASHNDLAAHLYTKDQELSTETISVQPIIDRVGTGDAFAGGLIYGLLMNKSPKQSLDFALACSVYKHSIPGDVLIASIEEIEEVLRGNSGAIKR
ncbi:sugar kinase [Algoriphagus limi]|uniref:Sugar kinase n=1 Tax=Algoriphagus limi TaxID=2975273 RepID=A0ABT2G6G2_9BACT|nr:sugar kinase [Algoriphagus limi]MCS5489532.1 sugar kinase [Algoriphagus limi]